MATLGCGHTFHAACVRTWFKGRPLTCPMCRAVSLDALALVSPRIVPKLEALVRTVPPQPRSFFPAYIIAHLATPVVIRAFDNDKNVLDMLVDIACECFTKDNFFVKIKSMKL